MNIIGTGLSGLVGSRVVELLAGEWTFRNLSLETGVDITKRESVEPYLRDSDAPWIFHFAAYTDVQGAEKDRPQGEESPAWKVNVGATQYFARYCKDHKKRLLYIDTDYAFDGKKSSYSEEDQPNPLGWYAITKYEGAKRVLDLGDLGLVIRISNPYRANPVRDKTLPGKKDFVHKMLERLQSGQDVRAPTDQLFVPTFIDDIAFAIRTLVAGNKSGVFHVVGSGPISPFEAAKTVADVFGCDTRHIMPTTFREMFADRAPAPQYAALSNKKIQSLGVVMRTFRQGLVEVSRQEVVR